MARTCLICQHPKRKAIERSFLAGTPTRSIAIRFDVSRGSVLRHVVHTARGLWRARRMADVAKAQDLADIAGEALVEARGLLAAAKRSEDRKAWGVAVQALQRHAELLGKLEGRIREQSLIVVLESPEWQAVEDRIFRALDSHPQARNLVARELLGLTAAIGGA